MSARGAVFAMAIAVVLVAGCSPTEEERLLREIEQEDKARAFESELYSEWRDEMLSCAEDHARTLYYGGDEYYAVTLGDLENCP